MNNKKNLIGRSICYLIGIWVLNTGIALTIQAGVGLSPISSLTRVMTLVYPPISQGTYSIMHNFLMFFGEFIVLPKEFKPKNFLQLIPTLIAGWFLDVNLYLLKPLSFDNYIVNVCLLVFGCFVLALGLYLMIRANLVLMPSDAFNSVLVRRTHMKWGNAKTIVDCCQVAATAIIGLVFLGRIEYIREGTIINGVICGQFIKLDTWIVDHIGKRFSLSKKEERVPSVHEARAKD